MGILFSSLSSKSWCNSFLDIDKQSFCQRNKNEKIHYLKKKTLLASTINNITSQPFVYLPHSERYWTCPPMSQTFMFTPPFFRFLTLRPIVGAVGKACPKDNWLIKVVLPLFSNPMSTTSILEEVKNCFIFSNNIPINEHFWLFAIYYFFSWIIFFFGFFLNSKNYVIFHFFFRWYFFFSSSFKKSNHSKTKI